MKLFADFPILFPYPNKSWTLRGARMPLEKSITNSILKAARQRGWWCYKVAGGGFQIAGLPDIHLELCGRALWFEVKQPKKSPTKGQVHMMNEIRRVGGSPCHVVTSREDALALLSSYEARFCGQEEDQNLDCGEP